MARGMVWWGRTFAWTEMRVHMLPLFVAKRILMDAVVLP